MRDAKRLKCREERGCFFSRGLGIETAFPRLGQENNQNKNTTTGTDNRRVKTKKTRYDIFISQCFGELY